MQAYSNMLNSLSFCTNEIKLSVGHKKCTYFVKESLKYVAFFLLNCGVFIVFFPHTSHYGFEHLAPSLLRSLALTICTPMNT